MAAQHVTVIDYGIGNLLNVVRALQHCKAEVTVIENATELTTLPERLVLPGVGAFADGMHEMRARGFDELVKRFAQTERPFLGICVGAQMLFDVGREFGNHEGLGLIAGRIQPVPDVDAQGKPHRIPHIGWSALVKPAQRQSWQGTPLENTSHGEAVYFVHSYAPQPADPKHRLANTFYNGVEICAAVAKDNVFGYQFHPERSAAAGLRMLQQFLAL
jgi:imidazole glycerol-phosphate synthase subunit HisH